MRLNSLTAISPIDGRYHKRAKQFSIYFSEYGLIRYRVWVEVEYFIALCKLGLPQLSGVDHNIFGKLRDLYINFNEEYADRIKEIESVTNHDVKAVEYFLKEEFKSLGIDKEAEFIHFGLTSQDINNTAIPLSLKHASENVLVPSLQKLIGMLASLATNWADIPMLARTHGQPASPTRVGKELNVFVQRLSGQLLTLQKIPYSAKFGGATGNFNAHAIAFPLVDWATFANGFVNNTLQISRTAITTQIEPYDNLSAWCHNLERINTILIDMCRDIWQYISIGYFTQRVKVTEVGSSAMPHKVNPIDFENAEGNLGVANALLHHLASKLPISRLQRDLTDSTVLRNLGVPIAHTYLSVQSILVGLDKLQINLPALEKDLENNIVVVAEGIQTILRREGYNNPYEALKDLTRGNQKITKEVIDNFIDRLNIDAIIKEELKAITPQSYTGI